MAASSLRPPERNLSPKTQPPFLPTSEQGCSPVTSKQSTMRQSTKMHIQNLFSQSFQSCNTTSSGKCATRPRNRQFWDPPPEVMHMILEDLDFVGTLRLRSACPQLRPFLSPSILCTTMGYERFEIECYRYCGLCYRSADQTSGLLKPTSGDLEHWCCACVD